MWYKYRMDATTLRQLFDSGKLSVDQLIGLHVEVCQKNAELDRENAKQRELLQSLEKRLAALESKRKDDPPPPPNQPYSLTAEDRRRRQKLLDQANKRRGKNKNKPERRGRISTAEKIQKAARTQDVYPEGVRPEDCSLSHTRVVWRLEDNAAILIAYRVWRSGNKYGKVPGVIGRCEFGLEFVLSIAFQVYVLGLSLDKVSLLTDFFQKVKLRKSQIDSILNQLSRFLESEFEKLCELLARSAIVHADETSWSIRSVWAMLSENARLLVFGVNKDAATLKMLLDPETFPGLVVSDHASVYGRFSKTQKCWAHIIRKAIKLTLLDQANQKFRTLCDELVSVYREAVRVKSDKRLSEIGRANKVVDLENRLIDLVVADCDLYDSKREGLLDDYRLLVHEVLTLVNDSELFSFVTTPDAQRPNNTPMPAVGTNNEAERTLRGPAIARKTGRTNKTVSGARRQTVIVSVLESLKCYIPTFRLSELVNEITSWQQLGQSCFQRQLNKLIGDDAKQKQSEPLLPRLIPSTA
jgi:hypothetical protein